MKISELNDVLGIDSSKLDYTFMVLNTAETAAGLQTTYKVSLKSLGNSIVEDFNVLMIDPSDAGHNIYSGTMSMNESDEYDTGLDMTVVGQYITSTDRNVLDSAVTGVEYDTTNKKIIATTYGTSNTDVVTTASLLNDMDLNITQITNTAGKTLATIDETSGKVSATFQDIEVAQSQVTGLTTALSNKLETSLKGANSGLAELDASGHVPSSQLPSYVDDVIEGTIATFPTTGETGKIYVDTTTNISYRWSGSQYVKVASDLALGETSSTAYRGDYGADAYAHSVTNKGIEVCNSVEDETTHEITKSPKLVKVQTNGEGHVTAATAVSADDIRGLTGIRASATTAGLAMAGGMGIAVNSNSGEMYISKAESTTIKAGNSDYQPIVTSNQHEATFYGLAKAASDTTQYLSSNAVGNYTDAAKVAIQKMLGIYEAPWELINEETFTNAETAHKEIATDSNDEAFELTEVMLLVELPKLDEDVASSTGSYGTVYFYYNTTEYISLEGNTMARAVGDDAKGLWYQIEYKNKLVKGACTSPTTSTNESPIRLRFITFNGNNADKQMGIMLANDFSINKISIRSVTGNCHYKLYGRRKWTT